MKKTFNNVVHLGTRLGWCALLFASVLIVEPVAAATSAPGLGQSPIVNFSAKNITLKEAIKKIQSQTKYEFSYDTRLESKLVNAVDVQLVNENLTSALEKLFEGTGISYKIVNKVILLSDRAQGKEKDVKVNITDKSGVPVPGATVIVKGKNKKGTSANASGQAMLNVKEGDVLVCSFIGLATQEIVVGENDVLNVVLLDATQKIDEVVVVGFGSQKKANLTGAVSTIDSKELTKRPINSTVEALQGTIPGMNISTGAGGGALNSNKSFNIRGIGTIGAGSKATPLVLIDGMDGDINSINPQDIENISVLKDAAASSIYGSRAPAGVILITTKKGKAGKVVVNYNDNFRFLSPLNMPEMADSYEYALYFNDADPNGNMFSDAKLQQIKDYRDGKTTTNMWGNSSNRWEVWDDVALLPAGNTDWLKAHFGSSFTQEHSLSVNGGTEQLQYYFSGNYLDQGGMLKYGDDNKQRYSLNAKINAKLNNYVSAGYNVRFVRSDYDAPSYLNDLFYHNMTRYWPIIPLTDPNGFYNGDSKVYQLTEGGRYKTQGDVLTQQLNFIIEPVKDFKIHAELNYRSNYDFNHTDWLTTYAYDVNKNPYVYDNAVSGVKEYAYKSNFFNPNVFAEYQKELNGGHTVKVMAGFQSELYKDRSLTGSKDIVQAIDIPTLNTTEKNPQVSGGYGNWSTAGFFGRLNYDYKGRYLAEVNMRYDGTSRFLSDKRWNLFPSFSLGWNVAREAFFERYTGVINNLKVRGSWGELGNQNTDNWYPFYRTIRYNKDANGNSALGSWLLNGTRPNIAAESGLVSSALTWEKIRTTNVGFDISMLNSRFSASFDWFRRESLDMVGPAPELPVILGTSVPKVNNLNMESQGFELQISWRDQIKDVNYGISFNLADARQKITKYPNPSKILSKYYDGAYIGDIWGLETIGIAKTNEEMNAHLAKLPNGGQDALGSNWGAGDIMYKDLNGDGVIDGGEDTADKPGDQKIIGNSTPRFNYGLNLDAAWKAFDLKIFFQGVMKRDYMASGMMFWGADGGKWQSMVYKPHLDYFRDDPNHPLGLNLNSYYPRPNWNDGKNRETQTRYMQNAAYCRLKNVTLGYTLPASLTNRFHINNLRVFVSGENLATFTKLSKMFDPELLGVGGWGDGKTYPLSKTLSFGLSLTL
jgi:TonB-linked SusC/RagA family outer membrane protein